MEKTFSIIKPDATKRNITGSINKIIEENGLRIVAQKRIKLSIYQAKDFYQIHSDKPFFNELIEYMTSEPVVVQVLSGNNAVETYRKIMGATNPENAEEGTIRKIHALNGYGLEITDQIPIEISSTTHNQTYLRTKRDRMGHILKNVDKAVEEKSD